MKLYRKVLFVWSKVLSFLLRWMVRLHVPTAVFEFVCLLLFVRPTARLMGRFLYDYADNSNPFTRQ